MQNLGESNRTRWAVQVALITGLALLFLAALLWGLQGVTPARADPGTLYVDGATGSDDSDCSSAADPCETIGYALGEADGGDEILVAEGTYTETLDISYDDLTLKGGYEAAGWTRDIAAHTTIIDADGADASVIGMHGVSGVTVEGFTVQGANYTSGVGGGLSIIAATSVVSGTVVRDNAAGMEGGGGIWIEEGGGAAELSLINSELLHNEAGEGGGLAGSGLVTLDNVSVISNAALSGGGGGLSGGGPIILEDVQVVGNTAQGSGGGINADKVTITNSAIVSNTAGGDGGGIHASEAHIVASEIIGNVADGASGAHGGGMWVDSVLHLRESVVSDNRAVAPDTSGGSGVAASRADVTIAGTRISDNKMGRSAVALYESVFTVTNSLIVNNDGDGIQGDDIPESGTLMNVSVAGNGGKGIRLTVDDVRITNSILWGNGDWDVAGDGTYTITYSDVGTGDTTGTGNISADPLFVDAVNGDYHLQARSPCIDAGTLVGAPTHDIEGTPRDAMPDMGAYEWTRFRIFLPLALRDFGP
jgi:predicted outer membrane repeat protein